MGHSGLCQDRRMVHAIKVTLRRIIGARRARAMRIFLTGLPTEDRFITADPRCPHPEWRHSRDREATEVEVTEAVRGLVRALQPEYVIETGTATAQTTIAIGEALRRNGHGHLVSVEVNAFLVRHARHLCRGLPVEVVERPSLEFTPTQPIDFAWLDSLPEIRHLEFRRYYPHMHSRTIVGFHDTGPMHPVRGFLDELEAEGLLRTLDFPTPRGFTLAKINAGS
jgi:hypothetical protein